MEVNRKIITGFVVLIIATHNLFSQYSKILDFNGSNGRYPYSCFAHSGDTLFGTTIQGGVGYNGTIFSMSSDGTKFKNIYTFSDTNGVYPRGLVISGKTLYGVTRLGGKHYKGNIYQIGINGDHFKTLFNFRDTLGEAPDSPLLIIGDTIFGVTGYGGKYNQGVLFRIRKDGSDFRKLKDFQINPYGSLAIHDNHLYGVTSGSTEGFIYRINTDGSGFTILRDYTGGGTPVPSTSVLLIDSVLYGGITYGNTQSDLFKMNVNGSGFRIIRKLKPGSLAIGNLVYKNNFIFGLSASLQTIFKTDTSGINFNEIHYFKPISGDSPFGTLFPFEHYLFGMTNQGGKYGYGSVFRFNLEPTQPSKQVSGIKAEELMCRQIRVAWNRGDGTNCAVFIREDSSSIFPIEDNLQYRANYRFGSGDQLDHSGWYCVYNGIDSSVTITDIKPDHIYEIRVIEYNVALFGDEKYYKTASASNRVVLKTPRCPQDIRFLSLPVLTYGDEDYELGAYSSSGLTVYYKSNDSAIATIENNAIKIAGAGSTDITAFQPGDSIYAPANDIIRHLVINKAWLNVSACDTFRFSGESNPAFILEYSGFVKSEDTANLIRIPAATCIAGINSLPGLYDIVVSGGLSNNYNFIYINGILRVDSALSGNNTDEEKITIYPTPATEYLYIKKTNPDFHIQIYDLNGKIMLDEQNQNGRIDIRSLSKGIYILKLKDISFRFEKL